MLPQWVQKKKKNSAKSHQLTDTPHIWLRNISMKKMKTLSTQGEAAETHTTNWNTISHTLIARNHNLRKSWDNYPWFTYQSPPQQGCGLCLYKCLSVWHALWFNFFFLYIRILLICQLLGIDFDCKNKSDVLLLLLYDVDKFTWIILIRWFIPTRVCISLPLRALCSIFPSIYFIRSCEPFVSLL